MNTRSRLWTLDQIKTKAGFNVNDGLHNEASSLLTDLGFFKQE